MNQPAAPQDPSTMTNPYAAQASQDMAQGLSLNNSGNMVMQQQQQMLDNYSGNGSAYPAMSNAFGLGSSQSTPIPGSASNPGYGSQPISITVPDSSSRGFNPWSLTGEANSRGK